MSVSAQSMPKQNFGLQRLPSANMTHLFEARGAGDLQTDSPEYDLADALDLLALKGENDDDQELEEFGAAGKRGFKEAQPQGEEEGAVVTKRRHQQESQKIRSPPSMPPNGCSQLSLPKADCAGYQTVNGTIPRFPPERFSNMPATFEPQSGTIEAQGIRDLQYFASNDGGLNSVVFAPIHCGKSQEGNIFFMSATSGQNTAHKQVPSVRHQRASSTDLSHDVETDEAPEHYSVEALSKIEEIKNGLMAEGPGQSSNILFGPKKDVCSGRKDIVHGPPLTLGQTFTSSGKSQVKVSGPPTGQLVHFSASTSIPSCVQPNIEANVPNLFSLSGPLTYMTGIGPPNHVSGNGPVTNVSGSGPVITGPPPSGPPATVLGGTSPAGRSPHGRIIGPPGNAAYLSTSPALQTEGAHGLNSIHSGSNSSISSCSSEKRSQNGNASKSSPLRLRTLSGTSGGSVTCNDMSPEVFSGQGYPALRRYSMSSTSSGSSRDNWSNFNGESPPASGVQLSTSPDTVQTQTSLSTYSFPPTPDSDSQSTSGSCQSPRGIMGHMIIGDRTPASPTVVSQVQSPVAQQIFPSPRHPASIPTPVNSPAQTFPYPQQSTKSAPENFLTQKEECASFPVPAFISRAPAMVPEPEIIVVSDDVLDGVCNESGVWKEDSEGDTFLHSLSGSENEDVEIERLHWVKHKPGFLRALNQYNKSSETPLYSAVCLGRVKLVEAMLCLGANVNVQCRYETQAHTPLHQAVEQGDTDMVETLLSSPHIDVNARRCSDKCTALMVALMKHKPGDPKQDRLEIITLIVDQDEDQRKPDFKAVDQRSGKTVLMLAVETKDIRVVDLILGEVGVDVARQLINVQNRAGNSALHLAAGLRDLPAQVKEQILIKLIKFGGETNKKNNEGDTPKDWARTMIDKVAKIK